MDASIKAAVAKAYCEESLLFFTRYMFKARTGSKFIVSQHHKIIVEHLEKVVRGEIKNLVINLPPRYGKTELAVINFMAWCFSKNPAAKFIHLSYADKLVLDNSAQVRELVKHEAFMWPLKFKQDTDAKGLWRTEEGGGLMASPAGGTITGFGAGTTELGAFRSKFGGAIIIDDPLKPDDAESEVERRNVNERLINTVMSRRNSRETPIILIMQRLHEDDMTGFVLAGKTGEEWTHLKLPALQEDGTALWPHKHNVLELQGMKAAAPYMFSGQYQQEPTPEDGAFFHRSYFKWYDELPKHTHRYGASDYAVTEGRGDWTVHGVLAVDEHEDLYVTDWWRAQTTPDVWVEKMLDMARDHKTMAWGVEKGVIDRTVGPLLNKRMRERSEYPALVRYHNATDKASRARTIQGRIAQRGLYLPRGKQWALDLVNECMKFPLGSHDDQVDVLSLFGRMLSGIRAGEIPKEKTETISTRMPTFDEMRKRNLQRLTGE